MTRCLCANSAEHPGCPVDHESIAESLAEAVTERIARTPYSDLRESCLFFLSARARSKRWPHGYSFCKWYRDQVEREILTQWGAME